MVRKINTLLTHNGNLDIDEGFTINKQRANIYKWMQLVKEILVNDDGFTIIFLDDKQRFISKQNKLEVHYK